MTDPAEANPDFVAFCMLIPQAKIPDIAEHLNAKIREFAKAYFQSSELNQEERLSRIFHKVSALTGRHMPHYDSENYFSQMIKNWKKEKNPTRTLLLETYFFLHCDRGGKVIADAIDRKIFGRVYFDNRGQRISTNEDNIGTTTDNNGADISRSNEDAVKALLTVASLVGEDKEKMSLLVDLIRSLSNGPGGRRMVGNQVLALAEWYGLESLKVTEGSIRGWLDAHLASMKAGNSRSYVPVYLAWLEHYHPKAARSFYEEMGISNQLG